MPTVLTIVLCLSGLFLPQLLLDLRRVVRNVGYLSGSYYPFGLDSAPGLLIARIAPPISYLNMGITWLLGKKYEDFVVAGQDAATLVTVFPRPKCTILLADAAAIKEISASRAKYPKPLHLYAVLAVFGVNIIGSEGEEWRRYRKIVAPAFSERNNRLLWDETSQIMTDLFDNVWGDSSEIIVDQFLDVTVPLALFVLSAAEFGQRITWTSESVVPPGHQMTFKDALHTLSTNLLLKIVLPNWASNLTKRTKQVQLAFMELKEYMSEMVEARRNVGKVEQRHDLFSGLLEAADDGEKLNDEELIGNMFIFLFAGHETTAHTLCFTFALLALHPDEQERLYHHIKGVMSSLNGEATYEDKSRFTHSLAVFYEALRMFPPITFIPKIAAEDTTLTVGNAHGGRTTFPVPSGTEVCIHVPGLHYNPRYWKDPHKYMPERFLGDWPKDAFVPFGQGARACVGRRFAETEGIAVINMLVSRYKIEVKEEPEFAGETFEERYARVTNFDQGITTTPMRVPLVFKRR